MPGVLLPTIRTYDITSHNTEKSCYVTVGTNIYDITSFLPDHPGGGDLIPKYGGKDVEEIMGDQVPHVHSEAAYEVLNDNLIGFVANEVTIEAVVEHDRLEDIVPMLPNNRAIREELISPSTGLSGVEDFAKETDVNAHYKSHRFLDVNKPIFASTGLSGVEDLTKETDLHDADYKTHRFLDLNKPLLGQVWYGGFSKDFYLEQVHRPRYYPGEDSAPLFGNALEPLSKIVWWLVPVIYLPPVILGTFVAGQGMSSRATTAVYWLLGTLSWPFTEYIVHRAVCHADRYLPDNRIAITSHFLLHGLHHYLPMDKYRLATPPFQFLMLAIPFYRFVHSIPFWDWYAATAVFCGWLFGYVYYEITHFVLHTKKLSGPYEELKRYHLQHHYADFENGFGITTRFWDRVFGTELPLHKAAVAR